MGQPTDRGNFEPIEQPGSVAPPAVVFDDVPPPPVGPASQSAAPPVIRFGASAAAGYNPTGEVPYVPRVFAFDTTMSAVLYDGDEPPAEDGDAAGAAVPGAVGPESDVAVPGGVPVQAAAAAPEPGVPVQAAVAAPEPGVPAGAGVPADLVPTVDLSDGDETSIAAGPVPTVDPTDGDETSIAAVAVRRPGIEPTVILPEAVSPEAVPPGAVSPEAVPPVEQPAAVAGPAESAGGASPEGEQGAAPRAGEDGGAAPLVANDGGAGVRAGNIDAGQSGASESEAGESGPGVETIAGVAAGTGEAGMPVSAPRAPAPHAPAPRALADPPAEAPEDPEQREALTVLWAEDAAEDDAAAPITRPVRIAPAPHASGAAGAGREAGARGEGGARDAAGAGEAGAPEETAVAAGAEPEQVAIRSAVEPAAGTDASSDGADAAGPTAVGPGADAAGLTVVDLGAERDAAGGGAAGAVPADSMQAAPAGADEAPAGPVPAGPTAGEAVPAAPATPDGAAPGADADAPVLLDAPASASAGAVPAAGGSESGAVEPAASAAAPAPGSAAPGSAAPGSAAPGSAAPGSAAPVSPVWAPTGSVSDDRPALAPDLIATMSFDPDITAQLREADGTFVFPLEADEAGEPAATTRASAQVAPPSGEPAAPAAPWTRPGGVERVSSGIAPNESRRAAFAPPGAFGVAPAGVAPAGVEPSGAEPAGVAPAGFRPAGAIPVSAAPPASIAPTLPPAIPVPSAGTTAGAPRGPLPPATIPGSPQPRAGDHGGLEDLFGPASSAEHGPSHPAGPTRRRGRLPLVIGVVVALLVIGYTGAQWYLADKVPKGTTVAGVELGGKTSSAARATLEQALGPVVATDVVLTAGSATTAVSPAKVGLTFDAAETAEGLTSFSMNPARLWRHLVGGGPEAPVVRLDEAKLKTQLSGIKDALEVEPVDAEVQFTKGKPTATEAVPGSRIVTAGLAGNLREHWLSGAKAITVPTTAVEPDVTRADADAALATANTVVSGPVVVAVGGQNPELPPEALAKAASFTTKDGALALTFDGEELIKAVVARTTNLLEAADDAHFSFANGAPKIVGGNPGTTIDPATISKAVADAAASPDNRTAKVEVVKTDPEDSVKVLQSLGIKEKVSEFSTPLTNDSLRTQNLVNGARKVTGALIKPGETWSLTKQLSPITAAGGYHAAGIINGGRHVQGIGGGLSQMATTTYNVAYRAGLQIVEHHPHSYYFARYPQGLDSTLAVGSKDMRFKNDTPYGVLMQSWVAGGRLHVALWSTKHFDVKQWTGGRFNVTRPGTTTLNRDDCEPQGRGQDGFWITSFRQVSLHGKLTKDEKFTVKYAPDNAVICEK